MSVVFVGMWCMQWCVGGNVCADDVWFSWHGTADNTLHYPNCKLELQLRRNYDVLTSWCRC